MHVLEAGADAAGRPCIVCLHGFPELAYSWRRQLLRPDIFQSVVLVSTPFGGPPSLPYLIHGAGHSVVEEQPDQVNRLLMAFLRQAQLTG
jgi:pimeloyl-ACP methyl ester carboxylesterase